MDTTKIVEFNEMTVKYHINPKTGNVSQCRAKINCRFAEYGENFPHFATKEGAVVDETLENGFHNGHIQSLEREVLLPRNVQFKISKIERSRFYDTEGNTVEPLTVFLEEVSEE